MKIRYINEAFKKISDLKKDTKAEITNDEFRKGTLKSIIDNVLSNEEFQKRCSGSIERFIGTKGFNNYDKFPGVMQFTYTGEKDGTLYLTAEVYYRNDATEKESSLRKIYLKDEIIKKTSSEEIRDYIENYIITEFYHAVKDECPYIENSLNKIHINEIKLWSNAPESIGGRFQELLILTFAKELYLNLPPVTDKDTLEIFDKLTSIFNFSYINNSVLKKVYVKLSKLDKRDITNIKDLIEEYEPAPKLDNLYKTCKKYINHPNLEEYKLSLLTTTVYVNDLLEYKYKDISKCIQNENNVIFKKTFLCTSSYDELFGNKEKIFKMCQDIHIYDNSCNEYEKPIENSEFFAVLYAQKFLTARKSYPYDITSFFYSMQVYLYGKYAGECMLGNKLI